MSAFWWVLGALAWLTCGVGHAGFSFAFFQGEFPHIAREYRNRDWWWAIAYIPFGPIALFATIMTKQTKHGWRLR